MTHNLKVGDKVKISGPTGTRGNWYCGTTQRMIDHYKEGKVHTVVSLHSYRTSDQDAVVISGLTEWFRCDELKKVSKPTIIILED